MTKILRTQSACVLVCCLVWCVCMCTAAPGANIASSQQLKEKLEAAEKAGDVKQALAQLAQLIALEPNNEYHYMKRASLNLRQRHYSLVLNDVEQALKINPTFVRALMIRADVYKLRGDCQEAAEAFRTVLENQASNTKAAEEMTAMQQCAQFTEVGRQMLNAKRYEEAKHYFTQALNLAPDAVKLLLLRTQCSVALRSHHDVLADTRVILQINENDLDGLAYRGHAYYMIGELDVAMNHYKRGLKLDPEHKLLMEYQKHAKLYARRLTAADEAKNQARLSDAIENYQSVIDMDPNHENLLPQLYLKLCECYSKNNQHKEAKQACTAVLDRDPQSVDALLMRADAKIQLEELDDAQADFNRVNEIQPNNHRAQDGLRRVQLERKKASRKDYYKILEIPKTANEKDVKKAFRKLAMQWHPDKVSAEDREEAEKKFRDIGEAYEVLSDEEKKRKYDLGEDIEMNQGFNPHQHFHHFQNFENMGGGHFHFQF